MGVIADIRSPIGKKAIDPARIEGLQGAVSRYLERIDSLLADPPYPTSYLAVDTEQLLAQDTDPHTGGTFTLTIQLVNSTLFTTAAIAFDDDDGTIESAIDTAATAASVPGWSDGDISVSAASGDLQNGDVELIFNGISVGERNHPLIVFNDSMTGGTSPAPRVTVEIPGQTKRTAWATLELISAISGSPPEQGTISPITADTGRHTFAAFPNNFVLRKLCEEASAEDGDPAGLLSSLLKVAGLTENNSSSAR